MIAMLSCFIIGLIWIVVFYVTQGAWPIKSFGYWNLIVGFGLLLTGFAMTMKWK